MARSFLHLFLLSTLPFLAGCFDSGSGSSSGGDRGGRISLEPSLDAGRALARVAPSGADGLQSFQVAVSDISLAKRLTTSGSGWSGIEGVLPLFSQDIGDHNAVDSNMARDPAWRLHFIDFCDARSLDRLASSRPFTVRDTGEYNWVVVNWAPFFRVRSAIPLPGGDTAYTHDGFIEKHAFPNSDRDDAFYYVTRPAASLLQGPAEDAVVRKNNAGTWFRFLRPLRLTEADLDTTALIPDTVGTDSAGNPVVHQIPSGRWNVLLVFNPRDLLLAGAQDSSNSSVIADIEAPDSSAYFRVPFLKATAVPYREGEEVMCETYEFPVGIDEAWARGEYGMRLELYLIGDNVVAATVHSYPVDGNLAPPEVPVIFFVEEKPDGTLSLQGYDRGALFDGFARKTAVGGTGSVSWNPDAGTGLSPAVLDYRLAGIRKAN